MGVKQMYGYFKLATLHTRTYGHGEEGKISREEFNL